MPFSLKLKSDPKLLVLFLKLCSWLDYLDLNFKVDYFKYLILKVEFLFVLQLRSPNTARRKTRITRRRTKTIAKSYVFHTSEIIRLTLRC